jgi:hypothetical protein
MHFMYSYPIKFEFPLISLGRQVDVRNGDGRFIMRAIDPYIAVKDAINIIDGSGNEVFQVKGDTPFRFFFRIFSMSWNWTITTPDERPVAFVDKYWARMEEFRNLRAETAEPVRNSDGTVSVGDFINAYAASTVNNELNRKVPRRLVYRVMDKEHGEVLGWIVPSRGTGWLDFLPYSTRQKIFSLPFASRIYAPSYEFKIGDLYSPTVLRLQKERDLLYDKYTLEKVSDLTDQQERWAIPALTLATMFERARFKDMT